MDSEKINSKYRNENDVLDLLRADDPDALEALINLFGDRIYGGLV